MKINQMRAFIIGEIGFPVYESKQNYLYADYLIYFYSNPPVPKACFLKERLQNQTILCRARHLRVEAYVGSCKHLKPRNKPK